MASRINLGNMKESKKLKRGESHDDEMRQLRCLLGWFPINDIVNDIVDVMVDFPRFASAQPQDSESVYIFNADRRALKLLLEDSHNASDFYGLVSISIVRHVTEGESDNRNELPEPVNDVAQLLYDNV